MRTASRAIVIKDNALLVMDRNKFGHQYLSLIGGSIDAGETKEQALLREILEETTIRVANPRLVIDEYAGEIYGRHYIFVCDYVSGEPKLDPNSVEAQITKDGKNLYTPKWLPLSELKDSNLQPKQLKDLVISFIEKGFPEAPVELTIID